MALTLLRGLSTLTVLKVLSYLELDEPESDNSTILKPSHACFSYPMTATTKSIMFQYSLR
jgi:hypothetical protein